MYSKTLKVQTSFLSYARNLLTIDCDTFSDFIGFCVCGLEEKLCKKNCWKRHWQIFDRY